MAYIGKIILNGSDYLVGSSMYGVCSDSATTINKTISAGTLGLTFDELIPGITVNIQFTNGNTQETISLQIGDTDRLSVHGNCKCGENAILQFTYGKVNNTDCWILNVGEKVAVNVLNYYDSTSTEPISGQGVADAIAPLIPGGDSPASLGVDTTIGNNPTNDKVPTSLAVANYITNSFSQFDALIYKGTLGANGDFTNLPASGYSAGWLYTVIEEGVYAGEQCEVGDVIFSIQDAGYFQISINPSHWAILQKNVQNAVSGPNSATQGNVAVFGADQKHIIDSGYTINTSVPANAVFTDTKYESSGNVQAITAIDYGTDITFATVLNGTLHIRPGLSSTKSSVITGIQEV